MLATLQIPKNLTTHQSSSFLVLEISESWGIYILLHSGWVLQCPLRTKECYDSWDWGVGMLFSGDDGRFERELGRRSMEPGKQSPWSDGRAYYALKERGPEVISSTP